METKASQDQVTSKQNLSTRIQANKNALRDFDEWCIQQLPPLVLDATILDLGCGNGKQLHLFSKYFSSRATFLGIDLSVQSLTQLQESYTTAPQLRLIEGTFDEENTYESIADQSLDLAYAAYALYYTKSLPSVVHHVYQKLKPGGIFWVVGPTSGTNREFLEILRPLHEVEPFMDYVFDDFMPAVSEACQDVGFKRVKPALLRNQVYFPHATAFMNYLKHSLFYRPGHDEAIETAVRQVCEQAGRFTVSKEVLSLQFEK